MKLMTWLQVFHQWLVRLFVSIGIVVSAFNSPLLVVIFVVLGLVAELIFWSVESMLVEINDGKLYIAKRSRSLKVKQFESMADALRCLSGGESND